MKRKLLTLSILFITVFLTSCALFNDAPVITGTENIVVEVKDADYDFISEFTITDDKDTIVLTNEDIDWGTFDINTLGDYEITATIKDQYDETASVTVTVSVVDTTKPEITVAEEEYTIEVFSDFEDGGSVCTDNYDECELVMDASEVNNELVGSYEVTYNVTDSSGNVADQQTATVNVVDTTIPVITLEQSVMTLEAYTDYVEEGASCTDNYDDDCNLVIDSSELDNKVLGMYNIYYNTTDANGNAAEQVIKTVSVIDTTSPTIELVGEEMVYHEVNTEYTDLGAACNDLVSDCVVDEVNTLDTTQTGTYTISYSATDNEDNVSETVTRTIVVQDTTAPVLTVTGDLTLTHTVYTEYVDAGVTCVDNFDAECEVVVTNVVDSDNLGVYTLEFSAVDANGNASLVHTREISVVDDVNPTLELVGYDVVYYNQFDDYVDLGAVCDDNYDNDCDVVVDFATIDTDVLGSQMLEFTVTDSSGNSVSLSREIVVQDAGDFYVELNDPEILYLELNQEYSDPGVSVFATGATAVADMAITTDTLGSYTVTYEVTGPNGEVAVLQRIVHVVDSLEMEMDAVNLLNAYTVNPELYLYLAQMDSDMNLVLSPDERSNVTELDLNGFNLKNVDMIPYFTNLVTLDMGNNDVGPNDACLAKDLAFLEALSLENLNVYNINCLNTLVSLNELNISGSRVYSISGLINLDLIHIDISNSSFKNISYFDGFENLEVINAANAKVESVAALTNLPIRELYLSDTFNDFASLALFANLEIAIIDGFDADLETSFLVDDLVNQGINVQVNSTTSFDMDNPNIINNAHDVYITVGESFDYSSLDVYAYDHTDGFMVSGFTYSTADTAVLPEGEHTITITITDSDLNEVTTTVTIIVFGDYDMSNIIIFINFPGEENYQSPLTFEELQDFYNGPEMSLTDYYRAVSFDQFNLLNYLYGDDIIFYTSENPRGYFQPYHEYTNPIGYQGDSESSQRGHDMLKAAINWVDSQGFVPNTVNLDQNDDGIIDNVSFLVSKDVDNWADFLWPHKWSLWEYLDQETGAPTAASPTINGDAAVTYTLQLLGENGRVSDYFDIGVIAHEMFHSIGSPDLYHYYAEQDLSPVGNWGLMDQTSDYPSHMLSYMKETYGGWDQDQIEVTESGVYTINRTTLQTDNALTIDTGYSNELLYLEYRTRGDEYEANLPNEGLLVYRVDLDSLGYGNRNGYYDEFGVGIDEVFIFRPIGIDSSIYNSENRIVMTSYGYVDGAAMKSSGLNTTGPTTNMWLFHSDGTPMDIQITVLDEDADTVTVDIQIGLQ